VFTTLKGESVETVKLTESLYIYEPEPKYPDEAEEEIQETDEQVASSDEDPASENDVEEPEEVSQDEQDDVLRPGEDVLIFLRRDEDSGKLVLTDYRDGLKRMPRADLAVYEAASRNSAPF
ncbi:MAG: hypothetical protein AB7J13_14825, partial [Pyrinomonadaceae bacterium]